jgi:GNAT superfamily N-acetyltransferase
VRDALTPPLPERFSLAVTAVRVREAEAGDFDAVSALLAELGRPALTPSTIDEARQVYLRHVGRADASSLVAEADDGTLVGFISLEFRDRLNRVSPQAWVPDLIVISGARGTGAGRALLERAFEVARGRGCYELTLESGWARDVAHRFYEIAGMSKGGYYFTFPL